MLIVNYKHNVRKEREQTMSKIKKLTDYSHLRHRIHMYLGGTDPHTQQILEIVNGSPELKTETWTPALYTGFREILDNASDEVVGHGHGTKIDVTYDPDKKIFSVEDDGRGIPFDYSEEYGMHLATMVLSEPRTGRNFDERKKLLEQMVLDPLQHLTLRNGLNSRSLKMEKYLNKNLMKAHWILQH